MGSFQFLLLENRTFSEIELNISSTNQTFRNHIETSEAQDCGHRNLWMKSGVNPATFAFTATTLEL
jgi:hypothetical protein